MIRFTHLFDTQDAHGGATVAYNPDTHEAGLAVCCVKDTFSRPFGRMLAEKQLADGRVSCDPPRTNTSRHNHARRFPRKFLLTGMSELEAKIFIATKLIDAGRAIGNVPVVARAMDWLGYLEEKMRSTGDDGSRVTDQETSRSG